MRDTTKFFQRAARKELRHIARLDRIHELETELAELREYEAELTEFLNHFYRVPGRKSV